MEHEPIWEDNQELFNPTQRASLNSELVRAALNGDYEEWLLMQPSEIRAEVRNVLTSLRKEFRQPIIYHFMEGMTIKLTAARLNLSVSSVKELISVGLEIIQKRLSRMGMYFSIAELVERLTGNYEKTLVSSSIRAKAKDLFRSVRISLSWARNVRKWAFGLIASLVVTVCLLTWNPFLHWGKSKGVESNKSKHVPTQKQTFSSNPYSSGSLY